MTLVRKMTAKRGSGRKKIIVIIGIISIIILAFMLARPGTSGLAIYNLGSFDSSNSLTSWSENEADGDGDFVDYSVDTTAYYSGGGSLRGASERGAGRNWSGEYLLEKVI